MQVVDVDMHAGGTGEVVFPLWRQDGSPRGSCGNPPGCDSGSVTGVVQEWARGDVGLLLK